MKERIYYRDQSEWNEEDFYYLFRYLNRMFLNKRDSRSEEILDLDLSLMSEKTKVLSLAILRQQKKRGVMVDFPNLVSLLDEVRLGEPLNLSKNPRGLYEEFVKMNIFL